MFPILIAPLALSLGILSACTTGPRAGHEPPPPDAVFLDDAGIRTALVGKTFTTRSQSGQLVTMTFHEDGTNSFEMGTQKLTERWKAADGQICITSPGYPRECDRVKQSADSVWFINAQTCKVENRYQRAP